MYEHCQVALCGIFSTTVKDAKKHHWHHVQGEVNALHKLDRNYYGLFGFMLVGETINEDLTVNSDTYEHITLALHLKQNNHLYQNFMARFETIYRQNC